MKYTLFTLATLLALTIVPSRAAPMEADPVYHLPAAPLELMINEGKYVPFARKLETDVDRLLAANPDGAREKLLLGIRVHLAHHFGENALALALAGRIRDLQTDPAEKAFAGMTTRAAVAARESSGAGPGDAAYGIAFAREYAARLAELPATQEIADMLRKEREKNAGFSREALLEEVRDKIGPEIERQGQCSIVEADQLVRVRHRLTDLLPVQEETLQALDHAIVVRSKP